MRLEIGLGARQEQRLQLLPQMLQAIEILQLSTTDLLSMVERELGENPTLELAEPSGEGTPRRGPRSRTGHEDEAPKPRARERDDFDPLSQVAEDRQQSLQAHLLEQLAGLELEADTRELLSFLIGSLDEQGHLGFDFDALLAICPDEDLVREALDLLHRLEPAGIGQAGPLEAMVAQIDPQDPDAEYLESLVRKHLEALARNQLPKVAKALGLELPEFKLLLTKLSRLDPCPGKRFSEREAELLRPEVVVRREDGAYEVYVDDARVPPIRLRDEHTSLAKDRRTDREVRKWLQGKLGSARELISSIQQRRETLGRVARAIFDRQRDFLEEGKGSLRPLGMQEIADAVGIHLSTVSRAIAHKSVQTDFGIFPLRMFFDGGKGVGGDAKGEGAESRHSIKERIRQLIEAEDKATPLSDEALVAALGEQGSKVARRTVAKYRKELGFPSSWRRRDY